MLSTGGELWSCGLDVALAVDLTMLLGRAILAVTKS